MQDNLELLWNVFMPGFSPHYGTILKEDFEPKAQVPLTYFNVKGKGDRLSHSECARYALYACVVGVCLQGFVFSAPMLIARSLGYDFPGVSSAVAGDWKTIAVFLFASFCLGCFGYYTHCHKIEAWTKLHINISNQDTWKCQPNKWPDSNTHRQSVILGTMNAGCAAVYGTATTILHLKGGYTKLYFDVAKHGLVWYLLSWPIFLLWIELFAYCFHRFFHLKFVYKTFHKLHHRFQPPTAFSAIAFHPFEFACYVFGGQAIFFFVPVHPSVMIIAGLYTGVQLIEDHTGIAMTPTWPWQPTTYFHDDHHKLFHLNFGQHTLLFDYLFGTLRVGGRKYGEDVFGGHGSGSGSGSAAAAAAAAKSSRSNVKCE